jgi:L-alanine-DL-glutamate epimerase-like enolase superfamily enzyme
LLKRDAMLIRVEADNGLAGYAPGPATEHAQMRIRDIIAPFLAGRVLADPDALRVRFLQGPGTDPALARLYCSVEIALYDLVGKAHGAPVSELLGGRVRERIRLYSSAGTYLPPEEYAEEAALMANSGFRAYKARPALGLEKDTHVVQSIREAVGPDFDLMVNAHSWWGAGRGYSADDIEQMARAMAEFNIAWLEEPLPPAGHSEYLRLKEKDIVPLAAGGSEPDEARYLDLILNQAVDYVQMDVCLKGGYAMGRRLLAESARQGLRFAFHSGATALEVAAAAHLAICWPEHVASWLEYPCYSNPPFPLAAEILKEPLTLDRGDLVVPRAPGLGVTIDESVVERYPWIPGPSEIVD